MQFSLRLFLLAILMAPAALHAQANDPPTVAEVIALKTLNAEKAAELLRAMFPNGPEINADTNALALRGAAGDNRIVVDAIAQLDPKAPRPKNPGPGSLRSYDVPSGIEPAALVELFTKKYADKPVFRMVANPPSRIFVYADPPTHAEIAKHLAQPALPKPKALPPEPIITETIVAKSDFTGIAPFVTVWEKTGVEIEVDYQGKTVALRGPKSRVNDAAGTLRLLFGEPEGKGAQPKKADPPAKGKTPAPIGEPFLRIHPLPGGNAEAIAKLLQDIFPAPKTRIVAVGPNQIAAWSDPLTHLELAKQKPLAPGVTVVIALDELNPAKTAATLKGMFGDPKTGGPFIEADSGSNSLRIRGSAEQVDEVKQVLVTLGKTRVVPQGNGVRTIILEEGRAATVAEALRLLLPKISPNRPLKVILPGDPGSDPPKKAPPEKNDAKPAKGAAPLTIVGFGNRLIVTCDDPEALDLVEQMVRIIVNTEVGRDFEVIRLKHAKAVDVAKLLDEAFNGPAAKKGKGVERIRVIADEATNSILLRARPLDSLSIRRLVTKSLDIPQAAGGDR
jgi:type II secretory pathway component GspD/PulD (secretin)